MFTVKGPLEFNLSQCPYLSDEEAKAEQVRRHQYRLVVSMVEEETSALCPFSHAVKLYLEILFTSSCPERSFSWRIGGSVTV